MDIHGTERNLYNKISWGLECGVLASMSKRDRSALITSGLVVGFLLGVGLALLFLVWAVPEFRDPVHRQTAESAQGQKDGKSPNQNERDEPYWWGWVRFLFKGEDTIAQWVMAIFAAAATVISYRAIVLVNRTLEANTAAVEQAKIANNQAKEAAAAAIAQTKEAHLQNIGNSPANRVRIASRIRYLIGDEKDPKNTISELSDYRDKRIRSDGRQKESRYAIAPKSAFEMEAMTDPIDAITGTPFNIVIFLSVTYEGAGITGIADTHSAFLFRVKHPNGGLVSHTIKGNMIKADQTGFQLVAGGFVT